MLYFFIFQIELCMMPNHFLHGVQSLHVIHFVFVISIDSLVHPFTQELNLRILAFLTRTRSILLGRVVISFERISAVTQHPFMLYHSLKL